MENKEFGRLLENRTKLFALSIIKLSSALPKNPERRVIKNQITKSVKSIRANYREANRSRSKSDFANKIKICESEGSETVYWLESIFDLNVVDQRAINSILKGANEVLAILTSIGKTLKLSAI